MLTYSKVFERGWYGEERGWYGGREWKVQDIKFGGLKMCAIILGLEFLKMCAIILGLEFCNHFFGQKKSR